MKLGGGLTGVNFGIVGGEAANFCGRLEIFKEEGEGKMNMRRFEERKNLGVIGHRLTLILALSSSLMLSLPNIPGAADYPTKPIQLIIPFAPGGGADITGRLVAEKVSSLLGQSVVAVNRAGGGGTIATYTVLAAPADGYTILVIQPPHISAPFLTKGVTFNILKDFTTFNLSVTSPSVVVVRKEAPWQTLEEFIAEAKKNPGKLTYSTPGYGSTEHFVGEIFKIRTGIDITQIPMEGTAPSVTAVLGGHINITFPHMGVASRYLKAGNLRGLAVNDKQRLKDFPEIPTTAEKGYPDLITATWGGFAVRAETPKEIVQILERVFKEALNDKDLTDKFVKTGWIVQNLDAKGAEEFLAKDYQRKSEVAKSIHMVPK